MSDTVNHDDVRKDLEWGVESWRCYYDVMPSPSIVWSSLGWSLHIKNGLFFMAIQHWLWFTELGRNILFFMAIYIEKRSPISEIFWGKKGNNNISIIFHYHSFCSSSIIIIYRIIKYSLTFSETVCLEIFALSIDFGVKVTKLGFTP